MARLKLYEYPHPILKQKTSKVDVVDDEIRKLLDDHFKGNAKFPDIPTDPGKAR